MIIYKYGNFEEVKNMSECERCLVLTDKTWFCQSLVVDRVHWLLCTECFLDLETTCDIKNFEVSEV